MEKLSTYKQFKQEFDENLAEAIDYISTCYLDFNYSYLNGELSDKEFERRKIELKNICVSVLVELLADAFVEQEDFETKKRYFLDALSDYLDSVLENIKLQDNAKEMSARKRTLDDVLEENFGNQKEKE